MVKKRWSYVLLSVSVVCVIILIIFSLFAQKNELTHIEKVIKNHNRVKESLSNPKYPILSPPANSKSTTINGDSVRVIQK